ncbi:phosphoenolpyruvate-protein kinase (PTS system EI component) [Corynebacterium lowii]|nr:phosphoenolpyruvate-protein kinase (PTS system EI component) [Corynebacterium lowii]
MTEGSGNNASDHLIAKGTGVVAGIAYADVVWVRPRPELPTSGHTIAEEDRDGEYERFVSAADTVAERLDRRAENAEGPAAEVLAATAGMVRDRGWRKAVRKNIRSGTDAPYAVVEATAKFVAMFNAAGGVMAERTTDLKDIRDRVIAQLRGEEEPGLPAIDGEAVLFADDLSPADTAALDIDHYRGLVTELGGPTSHTAIIARQLNLPCIVAAGSSIREFQAGQKCLSTAPWAPCAAVPIRWSPPAWSKNLRSAPPRLPSGPARPALRTITGCSFWPMCRTRTRRALPRKPRPRALAFIARR